MEYLAGLYTLLLVAICLELAVVLWRTGKKQDCTGSRRAQALDAAAAGCAG